MTRQFFAFSDTDLLNVYVRCTERRETQNFARRRIVHENKDGADATCILLGRVCRHIPGSTEVDVYSFAARPSMAFKCYLIYSYLRMFHVGYVPILYKLCLGHRLQP